MILWFSRIYQVSIVETWTVLLHFVIIFFAVFWVIRPDPIFPYNKFHF